jgi:hypothetical protein
MEELGGEAARKGGTMEAGKRTAGGAVKNRGQMEEQLEASH